MMDILLGILMILAILIILMTGVFIAFVVPLLIIYGIIYLIYDIIYQ